MRRVIIIVNDNKICLKGVDFYLKRAYNIIKKINSGWVEIPEVHRGGGIPRHFFCL